MKYKIYVFMYSLAREKIARSHHVFITSHHSCADATGSVCALTDFALHHGKKVYPFLSKPVPKYLLSLAHAPHIKTQLPNMLMFDVCIIADAGDLKQTGVENHLLNVLAQGKTPIINIDHHDTNNLFGHVNIVDKQASSTCELIYKLISTSGYFISADIAKCLLMGIVSDTGNFTNAATNEHSFKTASELILQGANLFDVIHKLFSLEESINTLHLWGKIFERLTYNEKYDIAVSYVYQNDLRECNVSEEAVEVVANFLNHIQGIKAGFLLKETKENTFKVSLRSTYPGVDVSRLAKMLGGGGHTKAAGFSVEHYDALLI